MTISFSVISICLSFFYSFPCKRNVLDERGRAQVASQILFLPKSRAVNTSATGVALTSLADPGVVVLRKGKEEGAPRRIGLDIWWIRFWCVSAPPGVQRTSFASYPRHGPSGAANDAAACTYPHVFGLHRVYTSGSYSRRLLQVHLLSVCTQSLVPCRSLLHMSANKISFKTAALTAI